MPRSIAEIRKANGGLANLTDEDILQRTFQTYKSYYPSLDAYAAEIGYGGAGRSLTGSRISAGIDQYQANLLGLGGAVARSVGAEDTAAAFDTRRVANESAAAYAAQRARDLGGIEDWRDVTGVGTGLNFVGGLAAQSLPYLGEAAAGALTGGLALGGTAARMGLTRAAASTAGAVGASYPSAVGDVLSAQREAGGENLGAAALGGIPYAALNALGIEGQLARGMRPLIQGEGGLARRLAVAVPTTAVAEGLSETGQEMINQYAGRMVIDPNETLFNEAANKRYLDSFVGGAALGGVFGGVGGLRSERPEQGAIDLTQPDTPAPLGKSITGTDPSALMGNPLAGANLLGGGYPVGLTAFGNAAQPTTPSLMSQETDLTAPAGAAGAAATTPLAAGTPAATTPAPSKLFSDDEQKLLSFGITPSGKTLAILPMILEAKLTEEQLDSVRTTLAQNKYKQAEKIIKQAAAQNIINAMSASAQGVTDGSTGISTVQQPAGGVGVGGAVVSGTLGTAGSDASLAGAVGGGAATTGAPLQQAGLLPNAAGQPSTVVDQGPTTRGAPGTTALVDTSDDALEIARATGNAAEIEAMRQDQEGGRADQLDFGNNEMEAVIDERFADSKNKERDRKILQAYILARKSVPEGYKGDVAQEVADTFNMDVSRVRQIGNPELLANIAEGMGFDRSQVFTHLGIDSAKKAAATELGKLESDLAKLEAKEAPSKADIAKMSELSEKIEQVKGNIESGDLTSALKEMGVEGEAGEMFASLDDSRDWQKASTAGSQMAVKLVGIADKIAELKAAAEALKQLGLAQAEAAATERINALAADYETLTASVTASKAERKQTKTEKKTEAAQKAAEEKDAAQAAEAEKLRAESAAKRAADRKGLEVGDTVMNPKLGTGVVKGFSGDGDATIVTVDFKSGQTKELSVKMAKLEKTNAVQVQSTASVPVQPKTEAGQGVGKQVRRAEKPASQGETQVLTNSEQAAQAWDKVASGYPTAPKFADLTKAQQQNFIDFGPDNWTEEDVNTELTKLAKSGLKFGKEVAVASEPYTAEELTAEIKDFVRADIPDRKLIIVDSIDDLLNSGTPAVRELGEAIEKKGAYGVAQGGVAYLVANRIQKGQGRAKFMHEVGAHLGLENLLPKAVYDRLVDQLEKWAESGKDSLEAKLAAKAKARVGYAKTPTVDEREELLAYFVEEAMLAGVDPTAMAKESGPLMAWFRTLWAAFKVAVRRLGFKPETLRAQDIVNMAFGAARLEMNGSWHGTAATFRRFNHKFMNSGEGAQAYGWGTYLAQAVGIGKGYWEADINRKHQSTVENTLKQYVGWRFAESVVHPIDREEIAYAGSQLKIAKDLVEAVYMNPAQFATPGYLARRFLEVGVDSIKLVSPTGEKKTIRLGAPEGSLMRLDTAVPTSEMIDWDASFAEQPKVVTDFIKKEAPNIKVLRDQGVNIQITSGAGIVKYLTARFYKEGGYKGSWKDADPAIKMAVKEQASKYLEANGIQGIQFYDANSRENTLDNVSFTKNGKTVKGRTGVLQAYFTPGAIVQGYGGPDKVIKFDPVKELITVIAVDNNGNPRRGERERTHFTIPSIEDVGVAMQQRGYDIGASNRTRNLVIFNEKNIFRAGSEAAADKQRMKFGFGGVEATGAKTFERRIELVQAQLDTANGVDPETIWKETGWYKGTDNKWRFEFDDSQAKFKQDFKDIDLYTEFKLSDVLDHPELFAQYPELKDVTFEKRKVMMDVWGSTQGWFDPKTKKLVVTPYARDPLSTVLHEVQHWIQSKEKFENGSSPQGSDLSNKAALTKLRNELQKAIDAYDASELESQARKARGERYSSNFDKFVEKNRAADLMGAVDALLANTAELAPMYSKVRALDSEVTRLETAKGVLEKKFKEENKKVNVLKRVANYAEQMKEIRFYSDKIKTISDEHYAANKELKARVVELTDGKDVAHELYRLVAGEAEARNVQSRMGMSFEERVKSFPAATMDVSPENTLTSTGRGGAYLSQERMKFGVNAPTQGTIQRNIAKLPKASQSPVRTIVRALGDLTGSGLDYVVFTSDLIKRAVDAGLTSAQTFADALSQRRARVSELEREIERIADGYADIEPEFKGAGRGSVNDFLFESTRTLKWGYDSGKLKADPEMAIAFNKLGPKAQQFVKNVFAHGDKILSQKKQVVLNSTNTEYDAMIQAAQDAVNAAQVAVNTATDAKLKKDAEAELDKRKAELSAVKAEKVATLKRFQTLFAIREGKPYAPIKRDGSWVVIGKSAEYKAAEAANDMVLKKKLESDADHYHVTFVDTKWQARTLSDNLSEQGVFAEPDIVKRADAFEEAFSGEALLPALTKIRSAVDKRNDSDRSKMLNIVNQLYLEALADGSARKSEMRRRGVAGEVDMLQSFTRQGRADANFIASVEFEPRIQDALQQMRNDRRGGDRTRKTEIFDELTKRYTDSLDPKGNAFITGLTNTASKYFLASSPAYYLQNLTQPFMMSLPAMAGRHNYTKAGKALFDAYAELGPLFKNVKLFDQQFDFSKVPADVQAAIKELVNQGQIDIGLATEINEYKVDADNKLGKFAQRLNKSMRLAVQKAEAINRLSTAIAAYRLEFAKTKDAKKATQYAAGILEDTHGDYTSMNAPRIFNSQWGQIALQFRKFQLIQIAFYAKLLRDAFTNPAERAVAMRTLAFSLGHSAVFAGMMGLPGYAAIAAILKAFSDEDEPYDLTAEMRNALGPEWADMVMRGAPTLVGVDLSGKIGSGNMLSIIPFSDADLSTTAGRAEAFGTLVGGASLGMVSRVADGLGLILSGDYYKGIERTMPKGISDALKAGRQAEEGMTRRNGDVVLPAEEISAISAILTGLGVPSVKEAVVYERQNRMRDVTQNFQERTTRIKNDYVRANKDNDAAAKQSAREAWMKLQKVRQENGLKVQPLSDLLKAPQEQAKRERMTVGGVQYTKATRKLAEEIAEE